MAFSAKRRFVAGAVCPRCSAMDKIRVYHQDGKDYRECVACGFNEEMRLNIAQGELQTRVNHSPDSSSQEVQVITILPLDADKD
ncbi:MAG TPA: YheV family putative zinc ribbon protein [Cellvibrio sp.]|nr:YheV family putative zinc ribbon protein [Cellvibrio sp.]